jgi:transcriptional regulator with XRE-family HTH domain
MVSPHSRRYQQFLKRLRIARQEAELTQVEVATRLGHPQSFVSKCESGERKVDVIEFAEFAELYGKSLEYFVSGARE